MQTIAFCDLDDTLFFTGRKLDEALRASTATLDRMGAPHSFMSRNQAHLLGTLLSGATIIPVTGRDPEAFGRVQLKFESWAILDHGATVLRPPAQPGQTGQPDRVWSLVIQETLAEQEQALRLAAQAAGHISDLMHLDCTVRLHEAGIPGTGGLAMMVVVKHPYALQNSLDILSQQWALWRQDAGIDLRFFANGNNLTLIARGVSKETAVEYVLEQVQDELGEQELLTLGLGDSLADAPFMNLCDFAITPGDSQLMRGLLENEFEQR
jgi:hydroxymethylpyrimidine pyrophosphatase-like HAD family hydrolase